MKKVYVKPMIVGQQFAPNEYVAACGDSGVVYKFKCNAGNGNSSYHVYLNGPDGIAHTSDDIDWSKRSGYLKPYSRCGTTHNAESDSGFEAGYMYEINFRTGNNIGNPIDVIVWTENGTNTHCTTYLKMSEWETAKS